MKVIQSTIIQNKIFKNALKIRVKLQEKASFVSKTLQICWEKLLGQLELFRPTLVGFINKKHEPVLWSEKMDWRDSFEKELVPRYFNQGLLQRYANRTVVFWEE